MPLRMRSRLLKAGFSIASTFSVSARRGLPAERKSRRWLATARFVARFATLTSSPVMESLAQGSSSVTTAFRCRNLTRSEPLDFATWLWFVRIATECYTGQAPAPQTRFASIWVRMREQLGRLAGMVASSTYSSRPIYLDYHATTPVDPRVAEVIRHALLEAFGNANSTDHAYGDEAAGMVAVAQRHVGKLVGGEPAAVQFTSGSTEAIQLAIWHAVRSRRTTGPLQVVASAVEHRAVLTALAVGEAQGDLVVRWAPVDERARLDVERLEALAQGADLVCVMAANNEVGTIYPVAEIARLAADAGADVLVDATQAAGRVELAAEVWGVTYLVLSAHKLYGPKGVGALVSAPGKRSDRHGTPNVPGIAGFGEACRLRIHERADDELRIAALRDRLEALLCARIPELSVNGDRERRLPSNLHISVEGVPNDAVVARLRSTVAISTGAACTSGTPEPSHVLRAMGLSSDRQDGALRIGLGKFTTPEEVERAAEHIATAVQSTRAAMGISR